MLRKLVPLVLLALALPAPPAAAQTSLVQDIAPGGSRGSSFPSGFRRVGDRLLFFATDHVGDRYAWATDGTALGTEILLDDCPGGCIGFETVLGATPDLVFWEAFAPNGSSERVLWRSDGTQGGTYRLAPPGVALGLGSSEQRDGLAALAGDRLFFQGCVGSSDCEPWVTDGTLAGTRLVADLFPGDQSSHPGQLTPFGRRVLFTARTDVFASGTSLWITDGTAAGTRVLADEIGPELLTAAAGRAFFVAEGADGRELWVTDGTAAGTRALTALAAPDPFIDTAWIKPVGNRVYLIANDIEHGHEIWRSDGTPAGTRRVTDFGFFDPFDLFPDRLASSELAEVGGRLIFLATDGLHEQGFWTSNGDPLSTSPLPNAEACASCRTHILQVGGRVIFSRHGEGLGQEPWVTDGTPAGTRLLRDTCPGPCSGLNASSRVVLFEGAAYFFASAGRGAALWRSAGTPAGTRRLASFGRPQTFGPALGRLGPALLFAAEDEHGVELWQRDPAGTGLLADLNAQGQPSDPHDLVAFGSSLAFFTCPGDDSRLWLSAGTPEATAPVYVNPVSFCGASHLQAVGGRLYFLDRGVATGTFAQVWASDGTPQGTFQLTHLLGDGEVATLPFALRGQAAFVIQTGSAVELWTTDGTPAGTSKTADLPAVPRTVLSVGDAVYYNTHDDDLVRSDGTPQGTRVLAGFESSGLEVPSFAALGPLVYFHARSQGTHQVWRTDGTPEGTVLLRGGFEVDDSSAGFSFVPFQGHMYFAVTAFNGPMSLWRSDGTAAGTVVVAELEAAGDPGLVAAGDRLFFAGDDGVHGKELWTSDGTPAGTRLVRDILPGPGSASPAELRAAGGRVFFQADDRRHGMELWESDGTAAGTRLVQDLAPGPAPSNPSQLTPAGDRLYFTADNGFTGVEPWVLPVGGPRCRTTDTSLCLRGRYQVDIAWRDFAGGSGAGQTRPLTADTGTFWFFDPANLELAVKVLDGGALNGHAWVFAGALTSVEYWLTVTDTETGASRRYFNPAGRLASFGDTRAFGPLGAAALAAHTTETGGTRPAAPARRDATAAEPCVPGPRRLCLGGGRFAVEAAWKDFQDHTGRGTAVSLTGDTGYFWFFDPANVEALVKIVDGRGLNGKFWFFYGALSNVEYTLTVTDTATGVRRTYANPRGRFASVADTGAF